MSEKNDFALVPRPPGALEKAEPGAKRILSGMVTDTLTLVRKTKPHPLRVFIVYYEEAPRVLIKRILEKQFERVTILEFERGDEAWQELSRTTPDLLITLDVMAGVMGEEIIRRLADKKATCPIIVLSGWGDSSEPWVRDFSNQGLNISLLQIPFNQLTFLKAVETALKKRRITIEKSVETAPQPRYERALRIVVLDDEEGPRRSCVVMLKSILHHGVEILEFGDALDAWQELSRTAPDLFITDIQHVGISCKEMLTRLAERKVKYPILVISAVLGVYEDSGEPVWVQAVRCDWSPNLNVSFLSKPYTYKEFRTAFEAALKITAQRAP